MHKITIKRKTKENDVFYSENTAVQYKNDEHVLTLVSPEKEVMVIVVPKGEKYTITGPAKEKK